MLMVARTGNSSTMTNSTSTSIPDTSYLSSMLKMNMNPKLLHPIESWSKQDVQKWIEYCTEEYSLGDVHLNDFEMNGKALLLLTEDNFKQRSSRSGDILHKALQQHRAMLKALHCQQTTQFQMWNNFGFPLMPSASPPMRRLNIPPTSSFPLPIPPFHSSAGVIPHSAFNYVLNPSETMTKHSAINNNRRNFQNSSPHLSTRQRQISASSTSSSSHNADINTVNTSEKSHRKSDYYNSNHELFDVKRETTPRQPTPNSSPLTTTTISPSIKQEYVDDEDVDIERNDSGPTPPITSSSRSSSPKSTSVVSKSNHTNEDPLQPKVRSQLFSRVKQQPNDVTNTPAKDLSSEGYNNGNDMTRQIRYFHDRIDFRGDILLKPPAAKNCRILWEFLYILLEDPRYESIIHWEDREKMIFRIIQADKLAALWGLQKNRLSMTYEKLSRGMRYYYSNNIISKEQSKRLLYRFMRSPDEIRKSMKRNGGTATMIYSATNKKTSTPFSSSVQDTLEDASVKSSPDHDDSCSSSSQVNNQSSMQMHNQFLQLFSMYRTTPSPASSIIPALSQVNNSLFSSNNLSSLSTPPSESKTITLNGISLKNDRSSSSSPSSYEGNRDRSNDNNEKQQINSSQTSSTKRKQAVPLSLTARLSNQQHQNHHSDQPLNLAVHRDESNSAVDYKKIKIGSPAPIA